jgi:tetratricopeptide (TPR) repeat protein
VVLAATVLLAVVGTAGMALSCGLRLQAERNARQAHLSREVNDALSGATALREEARAANIGGGALAAQAREQAQRALALVESGQVAEKLEAQALSLQANLDEEEMDRRLLAALDAARLAQTGLNEEKSYFAVERAVPLFREAFRAYGLPAGEGGSAAAAARIRQRPAAVREGILAALDEWIDLSANRAFGINEPHLDWLRAVLAAAEPNDAWARQVRAARAQGDAAKIRATLERLAASADVTKVPPRALTRLAWSVDPTPRVALLRRTQRHYPADFWINHDLGMALFQATPPQLEEAVRFLTVAVALRPDSPGAQLNLGNALYNKGQLDEAIACYRKAIELDPRYAMAHNNLGHALENKGQLDEAIACYQKAIALDPKHPAAHNNLGSALRGKGKLDEAIACYKKAITLEPRFVKAYLELGNALRDKGQLDEAVACYHRAIELDPKDAAPHLNLGAALYGKGQVDDAIVCWRKAVELDTRDAVAHRNLKINHRYNAARAAASAAAGKGGVRLDDAAKAKLRNLARYSLRIDLTAWGKLLDSGQPQARPAVVRTLRHWQKDVDLAGIRDAAALATLPAEERAACERLWTDVAALLKKAQP